ncbi:MAG: hypothetical protein IMZ71_05495 [Chloroflexi bacterium]|nr:hypothetical protein [Chloroflexota bacterium]
MDTKFYSMDYEELKARKDVLSGIIFPPGQKETTSHIVYDPFIPVWRDMGEALAVLSRAREKLQA